MKTIASNIVPILWWLLLLGIAGGIEQGTIAVYTGALWLIIVLLAGFLAAALLQIVQEK